MIFLRLLPLLLCTGLTPGADETASFLILTDPARHSILNRYEEPLAPAERAVLRPGTPLQVADSSGTLGDGLTPAVKGFVDGALFLIVKNARWDSLPAKLKTYLKGCRPLGDTLTVTAARAISVEPQGGKTVVLDKGERLIRIFQQGKKFYLKRQGDYGWSTLTPSSAWRIEKEAPPAAAPALLDSALTREIEARFAAANKDYRTVFEFLNRQTAQGKFTPLWRVSVEESRVRATLIGPESYKNLFRESTRLLKQKIENGLAGRPWSVAWREDEITVSPRGSAP